jgi:hypothetical protein
MFVPPTIRKPKEYLEARRLRGTEGLPYKRIAAKLGVSSCSVYLWTNDIPITDEQRRRNLQHQSPGTETVMKRAAAWAELNRERRRGYQREGRERAMAGDPLHLAGCMLYWAEGAKGRNVVKFVNSDPQMMRFFRQFLGESLGVGPEGMTVRLHVYLGNGLTIGEIEDFWLKTLDLPRSCLRGHTINPLPTSSSGTKRNKLPYGVCTLAVHKTQLLQHIYGAIQEYAGFDEPRWLDGPKTKSYPRKSQPDSVRGFHLGSVQDG